MVQAFAFVPKIAIFVYLCTEEDIGIESVGIFHGYLVFL
jgi:hypothetical protein